MSVVTDRTDDNRTGSCTSDGCRMKIPPISMPNSVYDPGLDIELRWEQWTSCDQMIPSQRREAHCYVVTRPGFSVDEDAEKIAFNVEEFKWMVLLRRLVNVDGLRRRGVRLHSSIVASLLYRKTILSGFERIEEGILISADDVWRKHFLQPIEAVNAVRKYMDRNEFLHFLLKNPFQACLRYEKLPETNELLVGSYMVETRNCP